MKIQKIVSGQWFYPVQDFVYDKAYFEKYVSYQPTKIGKNLTKFRTGLIKEYNHKPTEHLDVGVGSCDVVDCLECKGYDVNPYAVNLLAEKGQFVDLYSDEVEFCNTISFFDSFEHIKDLDKALNQISSQVVIISLPIYEGKEKDLPDWKHFRTDEHFHYFTDAGFRSFINSRGFTILKVSKGETIIGREDILTYVIKRVGKWTKQQ